MSIHGLGFFAVVTSTGPFGMLIWLGIFFWTVVLLPLGLISIVHSAKVRSRQMPLATKLLACGAASVLILGCTGAARGGIGAFDYIAAMGSNVTAVLSLNIALALYSAAGGFLIGHLYLVFFLVSIVILHFKHRHLSEA